LEVKVSDNRYANVFLSDGRLLVFPFAITSDGPFTIDDCSASLAEGDPGDRVGSAIRDALTRFGREISVAEFKSRRDPLLAATNYRSHKKLSAAGLGHLEVNLLLDDDGRFKLVPYRKRGG
jgi:hypothetical protein